jgi:hypothetical protein
VCDEILLVVEEQKAHGGPRAPDAVASKEAEDSRNGGACNQDVTGVAAQLPAIVDAPEQLEVDRNGERASFLH